MKIYREAKGIPEPEEKPKEGVSLEKPQGSYVDVTVDGDEDKDKEIEQPIWTRPYEPSWQQNKESEPKAEPDAKSEDLDEPGKSSDDKGDDYSQFGSAWDQNVNR
jgi:hypothetical protein